MTSVDSPQNTGDSVGEEWSDHEISSSNSHHHQRHRNNKSPSTSSVSSKTNSVTSKSQNLFDSLLQSSRPVLDHAGIILSPTSSTTPSSVINTTTINTALPLENKTLTNTSNPLPLDNTITTTTTTTSHSSPPIPSFAHYPHDSSSDSDAKPIRRKRRRHELTDDIGQPLSDDQVQERRKQHRRAKNREAARNSRNRKREYIEQLEQKVAVLNSEKNQLEQTVKQMMLDHQHAMARITELEQRFQLQSQLQSQSQPQAQAQAQLPQPQPQPSLISQLQLPVLIENKPTSTNIHEQSQSQIQPQPVLQPTTHIATPILPSSTSSSSLSSLSCDSTHIISATSNPISIHSMHLDADEFHTSTMNEIGVNDLSGMIALGSEILCDSAVVVTSSPLSKMISTFCHHNGQSNHTTQFNRLMNHVSSNSSSSSSSNNNNNNNRSFISPYLWMQIWLLTCLYLTLTMNLSHSIHLSTHGINQTLCNNHDDVTNSDSLCGSDDESDQVYDDNNVKKYVRCRKRNQHQQHPYSTNVAS